MNSKYGKVMSIEMISDKLGHKGKKLVIAQCTEGAGGKVRVLNRTATRNFWGKRTFPGTDGVVKEIKADLLYTIAEVGLELSGAIMKFDTTDYDVNGRMINTWTGFVFEDESGLKLCYDNIKAQGGAPKDPKTDDVVTFTAATTKVVKKNVQPDLDEEPVTAGDKEVVEP